MTAEEEAENFLKEIESDVVQVQREIASNAMDVLFERSPHYSPNGDSPYALGEYDANHKVTLSTKTRRTVSTHYGPTRSVSLSRSLHEQEKSKIEAVEEFGMDISIENTTYDHREEVENGTGWVTASAYRPYTHAIHETKVKFGEYLS